MESEYRYRQDTEALFDDDEVYIDDLEASLKLYPETERQYKRAQNIRRALFGVSLLTLFGGLYEALIAQANKNNGLDYLGHEQNSWLAVITAGVLIASGLIIDNIAVNRIRTEQFEFKLNGSKGKFTKLVK
ncbi:MAG: hypothetical protein A3B38_04515 [Candidatus Levybacteria bacterium RIFCSPLOWO2_01_FULL_36_13]|nr:MAG: hypothetical protein A2684_00265 [Candidatus Levybacteria bacterium RIFCSPHIGHO2_01_FULL_36_15b]OGH34092.1 MAG: hypothetical protein A3B38_04515 [Candidatus Levybacteria bacterium RIFCSPLOWO2_01_FULL_36_13]